MVTAAQVQLAEVACRRQRAALPVVTWPRWRGGVYAFAGLARPPGAQRFAGHAEEDLSFYHASAKLLSWPVCQPGCAPQYLL